MGVLKRTSLLIPAADLPLEARYQVVEQARQIAIARAQADAVLMDKDHALRQLNGVDLGLARYTFEEQVSAVAGGNNSTYENSSINVGANHAERSDRYLVIYGCVVASSVDSLAGVRWQIGGSVTHQWDFRAVLATDPHLQSRAERTLYVYPPPMGPDPDLSWIDPVEIPSRTSVQVQHYVRGGVNVGIQPSDIEYLGWVIEPVSGGGAGLYGGNF